MRVALCIGNTAELGRRIPKAYITGYNNDKTNILDKCDNVDVFLHSQEPHLKDELLQLYKPVDCKFETGILDLSSIIPDRCKNIPTVASMLYSRSVLGKLKSDFEKSNGFRYDWVIFVRYDVGTTPHGGDIENIYFDPTLDSNYIYTAMFTQLNAGIQDQWWYSNSADSDIMFSLYENLSDYLTEESDYLKCVTNGWIYSRVQPEGEFSNELLKPESVRRSDQHLPLWHTSNPHYLYKWHLYKHNLLSLDKMKFICTRDNYQYVFPEEPHPNIIRAKL